MRYFLLVSLFLLSILSLNCAQLQYTYTYTANTPAIGAPHKVFMVYVDKTFSEGDKEAIDNAIDQWNYALNQQMALKVVSHQFDMEPDILMQAQKGGIFMILKVDNKTPGIPDEVPEEKCRRMMPCYLTLAWADALGGTTIKVVRNRVSEGDIEYLMLHEIGHLLSLQHIKTTDSLMYRHYSRYAYLCVDQDAVSAVSKIHKLDFAHMNYCVNKK